MIGDTIGSVFLCPLPSHVSVLPRHPEFCFSKLNFSTDMDTRKKSTGGKG